MDLEQEEFLIGKVKSQGEAFGELYDAYYPQIFGYILKRTANIPLAQDITSDVFFTALKNIDQFHWRGIPFSSWLYRIAANEIADNFKKNRRQQAAVEAMSDPADISNASTESEFAQAEEELNQHQEFLALHGNILKLSLKYQEVIVLRFFEDKPINEIAAILGKPEGTVKSLLHRGLEKLRTLME